MKKMTETEKKIVEKLMAVDHIQAKRYAKLDGTALEIATEGIIRHFRACDRMDVPYDAAAAREIIDDAHNGRRVFAEDFSQKVA